VTAWFRRLPTAVVLALACAIATGCGSTSSSSPASGAAAGAVPADALFYADVDLDTQSPAWKQFAAVGQRFPGWQQLVDQIVNSVSEGSPSATNVSLGSAPTTTFEDDIEPWLGDSAAIAVTSVDAGSESVHWVGFVASTDDSKAKAAFVKSGSSDDGTYHGYSLFRADDGKSEGAVGDGAVLIGDDAGTVKDSIDLRGGGGDSLSSSPAFSDAMAKLPSDSLLRGWANTEKLSQLAGFAALGSGSAQSGQIQRVAEALGGLDSLTFAAWASDAGYHLTLRTTVKDGANDSLFAGQAVASPLLPLVPSDAFAFLAVHGYGTYLQQMVRQGGTTGLQLDQFERETGISFTHDLVPLLSGDSLLYAAPGIPLRAALLLKPDDPDAASATMHKLFALVAHEAPGTGVHELAGGSGESITLDNGLTVTWRRTADGLIAVGNDSQAGASPAARLASSEAFTGLLQRAEAPSDAVVPFYLDTHGLLKLIPIDTDPNLGHVGGIVGWSTHDGNAYSSDLFVEVR
jgi:hypothetical protein